ncbi:MAG: glycosyltransferase [Candidatus Omnitrophica bacterium]|nr:glycosyltransferase [Candidatus Omnitrophota bacterium]
MTHTSYPKVSIVVPAYNRARLLEGCLLNLLEQTYPDLEIIVVDDGSTDDTARVVEATDDGRLKYIRHDINRGLPAARNTGIRASSGEFIAFQDTDDRWEKDKTRIQMDIFRDLPLEVGVVYSNVSRAVGGREYIVPGKKHAGDGNIRTGILYGNFIAVISAVVRRACFDKAGYFDERLPSLEDWELWIRISRSYRFRFVENVLARVNYTEDSLTANVRYTIEAREIILKKHHKLFLGERQALAKNYAQLGWDHCLNGETPQGRNWCGKAVRTAHGPVYCLVYLITLLGENAVKFLNDLYLKIKRAASGA